MVSPMSAKPLAEPCYRDSQFTVTLGGHNGAMPETPKGDSEA